MRIGFVIINLSCFLFLACTFIPLGSVSSSPISKSGVLCERQECLRRSNSSDAVFVCGSGDCPESLLELLSITELESVFFIPATDSPEVSERDVVIHPSLQNGSPGTICRYGICPPPMPLIPNHPNTPGTICEYGICPQNPSAFPEATTFQDLSGVDFNRTIQPGRFNDVSY